MLTPLSDWDGVVIKKSHSERRNSIGAHIYTNKTIKRHSIYLKISYIYAYVYMSMGLLKPTKTKNHLADYKSVCPS